MNSRSFWHHSLCDSSDEGRNTTSFRTSFGLLPPPQHPSPLSTMVLSLMSGPSPANPRTSFSMVKFRWLPSGHHSLPSASKDSCETVPLTLTRSDIMAAGRSITSVNRFDGKVMLMTIKKITNTIWAFGGQRVMLMTWVRRKQCLLALLFTQHD